MAKNPSSYWGHVHGDLFQENLTISAFGAFNSTNFEWITVTHEDKLALGSNDFSVSLWFKGSTGGGLATCGSGSNNWLLELQGSGDVSATVAGTSITSDAATYKDSNWHFAQFSADRSREKLGLLVDMTYKEVDFTGPAIGTGDIIISAGSPPIGHANGFSGAISEVRLRNYALVPQPLPALPTCQEGDTPGTLLLLHLNDSHGSTIMDSSSGAVSASSTPSHASAVITNFVDDASHWDTNGPIFAPPLILAKELIIYAIDEDSNLLDYLSQNRIDFHRSRTEDQVAYLTEVPQMSLVPLQTGPSSNLEHRFGWEGLSATQRLSVSASPRFTLTPTMLEELEHLITRALFQRAKDTGDTFGCYHVNGWEIGEVLVDAESDEAGTGGPAFFMDMTFEFNKDLRNASQP